MIYKVSAKTLILFLYFYIIIKQGGTQTMYDMGGMGGGYGIMPGGCYGGGGNYGMPDYGMGGSYGNYGNNCGYPPNYGGGGYPPNYGGGGGYNNGGSNYQPNYPNYTSPPPSGIQTFFDPIDGYTGMPITNYRTLFQQSGGNSGPGGNPWLYGFGNIGNGGYIS